MRLLGRCLAVGIQTKLLTHPRKSHIALRQAIPNLLRKPRQDLPQISAGNVVDPHVQNGPASPASRSRTGPDRPRRNPRPVHYSLESLVHQRTQRHFLSLRFVLQGFAEFPSRGDRKIRSGGRTSPRTQQSPPTRSENGVNRRCQIVVSVGLQLLRCGLQAGADALGHAGSSRLAPFGPGPARRARGGVGHLVSSNQHCDAMPGRLGGRDGLSQHPQQYP